ncbi:GNAT family N-acetyltransferase [Chitinophaga sp. Cy-1792]|uniref:GNAT family N-acetyltransferase n=1 Tax=Chitinophaga sp. Cy-1792 TaxID=2608339 RepID=UPI00142490F9|nr:GNAT family N-acetyltransferase [Chitinophaga sp. Cy-1792]NIG54058.1 GNAT family N-acetyltransferase [Chitinophaga sp. Cy-1792]
MSYHIRPCEETDLDKLIQLCAAHAAYEQAAYTPDGKKERLHEALFGNDKTLKCLVAVVDDEVIGYATYTFDFSTWDAQQFVYLDCLYIEEAYRNLGIGRILMDEIQAVGHSNNCVNMQWQTPDFNERAIRFYKRIGGIGKNKVRFTLPLY